MLCCVKPQEKHKVLIRRQKQESGGQPKLNPLMGFPKARQSRTNSIGLVSKNCSGKLMAVKLVSRYLVPGSGMI